MELTYENGSKYSRLDIFGRVIETLWKKDGTVMQNSSYGYDRASNRKWRRDDLAHSVVGDEATRHDNFYHYDGLYQVIGRELGDLVGTPNYTGIAGAIQDEEWCYDATGNWQKYDSAAEANLQQIRYHNAANEITHVANPSGVIQPTYDKVGNQTIDIAPGDWDRGFTLKWDAWNRLVEVKDGNTLIQSNVYDGISRRITSSDGTDITHYYYNDAWRSVEEYTDADPEDPTSRYLWGLRSRWDLVKRERSDSGTLDEKRYVLYDAMDPVAICNGSGNIVQRFEYSPFGRTTFLNSAFVPVTPNDDWTFLFHGEFRDAATGYYNYGYRFYNDTTGRWLSRDPIGERGGLNRFKYVSNRPTTLLDRFGLLDCPVNCAGVNVGRLTGEFGFGDGNRRLPTNEFATGASAIIQFNKTAEWEAKPYCCEEIKFIQIVKTNASVRELTTNGFFADNLSIRDPYYGSTVPKGGDVPGSEGETTVADSTLYDLPRRHLFADFPHDIEWTAWTFVVCISKCVTKRRTAFGGINRFGLVLMQGIKWGFTRSAVDGAYSPPELLEAECVNTGGDGPTEDDIVEAVNIEGKQNTASIRNGFITIGSGPI